MSECFPTKTIALEYISCADPSQEDAFNDWYNQVYIPAQQNNTEIRTISRYRSISDTLINVDQYQFMANKLQNDSTQYLTLYGLSPTLSWDHTQHTFRASEEFHALLNWADIHVVTVWDFLAYRRTILPSHHPETHLPDGMPETIMVMPTFCRDISRESEFNDWYFNTHFHDLLKTPGVLQASRFNNCNPNIDVGDPQYLAIYEMVSDDIPSVIQQIFLDDQHVRKPQGRMINCIGISYGTGIYKHM